MESTQDRTVTPGEELLSRASAAHDALAREAQRVHDPLLYPEHLRGVIADVRDVAQENVHLRIVADATQEFLIAEFEDDRYFAREKMKATVTAWQEWKSQRDAR